MAISKTNQQTVVSVGPSATYSTLGASLSGIPTTLRDGEEPGTKLVVSKTGLVTITSKFKISAAAFAGILPDLYQSPHPRYPWALMDEDFVCTEVPGSMVEIDGTYRGTQATTQWLPTAPNDYAPPTYHAGLATAEEPIFTNPFFDDITPLEKLYVKRLVEASDGLTYPAEYAGWPANKKKLYDLLASSKDAWKATRDTWTATYNSTRPISAGVMAKRGKICTPWGQPPALPDERNWLLDSITQVKTGGSHNISLTWLASGPGGWDKDLYTDS